jgi:hypothetical protein
MRFRTFSVILCVFLLLDSCGRVPSGLDENDPEMHILIDTDPDYPEHPRIVMENSMFKAVFRVNEGGVTGIEHAIRDWILKSTKQDQVDLFVDACAQRPPCVDAYLIKDDISCKSVQMIFGDRQFINVYTIFPNSPLIKIEYNKYDHKESYWCNTVDIGTPGGLSQRYRAKTIVYGSDRHLRDISYHEDSYWNTFDGGEYAQDPLDGGALNYHDHVIMLVGNPETGIGFGRIMPVYLKGRQGGIRILKLLWDRGFETFAATGKSQTYRPAFTGYVFLFDKGFEPAVDFAKSVIDSEG